MFIALCDAVFSQPNVNFKIICIISFTLESMPMCVCGSATPCLYACDCNVYVRLNLFAQHPTVTGYCDTTLCLFLRLHPPRSISSDFHSWSHFHSIILGVIPVSNSQRIPATSTITSLPLNPIYPCTFMCTLDTADGTHKGIHKKLLLLCWTLLWRQLCIISSCMLSIESIENSNFVRFRSFFIYTHRKQSNTKCSMYDTSMVLERRSRKCERKKEFLRAEQEIRFRFNNIWMCDVVVSDIFICTRHDGKMAASVKEVEKKKTMCKCSLMDRCESIEGDNIICKHSKLQFGITSGTLLHTHTQYLKASDSTSKKHTLDVCTFVCVCVCCFFHSRLFCYSKQYIQMRLSTCCCYMSSAMHRCFAAFQTKYENEIWKKLAQEKRDTHKRLFVGWKLTGTHLRSFAHFRQQNQMTNFHYVFSKQKKNIAYTCCVAQTL